MPAGSGNSGGAAQNMGNTAYFDSTYRETMTLLVQARDYALATRGAASATPMNQVEALRVTARLTQIMAWLLGQRAVIAGEISTRQALRRFSLSAGMRRICVEHGGVDDPSVPAPLRELLDASGKLYERVCRLEAMAAARTAS